MTKIVRLILVSVLFFLTSNSWAQDDRINLFPITDVGPDYPSEAIIQGTEGWVLVSFDVSSVGFVSNINVRNSEPRFTFDEAAIEAARQLRFSPYIENGVARDVSALEYLFKFELSESPELVVPRNEISLNDASQNSRTNQRNPSITQIANENMLPTSTVTPSYPEDAENQNLGGWVLLRFTVTEQGTVQNPIVEDSEPQGVFDGSAIQAIREFRYEPQTSNGILIEKLNVFHMFKFRPST